MAERVQKLRTHGWALKYYTEMLGYNSRLDEIQAAILRVKLRHLDTWNERRRAIAKRYQDLLAEVGVKLPWEAPYAKHVYHLFIVRVAERRAVQENLRAQGVASGIYYPRPLHFLKVYQSLGYRPGDLPESEQAAEETLAIPLYPEMTDEQIVAVSSALKKASRCRTEALRATEEIEL